MFILAAAGSAIGLGNIWRFPYMTGQYGGGAFVLLYLAFVVIVVYPILIAEIIIGRETRRNPVGAFRRLSKKNPFWSIVGLMGVTSGFVILSYYSVVAGWTLDYFVKYVINFFVDKSTTEQIQGVFGGMVSDAGEQVTWHTVFMAACVGIVIFGVKEGLERWVELLMPALFICLLILLFYGLFKGDASGALKFLFYPEWKKLVTNELGQYTPRPMLESMGQAFFSLSIGMGAMITYGSYLGDNVKVSGAAATVAILDTLIAIIAGIAIYTILFAYNLEPAQGPGLVFKVLPLAFATMPGGRFVAIVFFVLLAFAALTSAISLLEVVVAFLIDQLKWKRRLATLLAGGVIYGLGIFSAFSYNVLKNINIFHDKDGKGMPILDSMDLLANNYMLPIGGFFIALFIGWFIKREIKKRQMLEGQGGEFFYRVWNIVVKFIAPVAVAFLIILKIDHHLGLGIFGR
jgi:NSS family neurotransmitter:Na+ symporter